MTTADEEQYQQRLGLLTDILADIAGHAQAVSKERCPYMTVQRACTAKFRCRNQRPQETEPPGLGCGHDGKFDYRSAWELRPDSYEKTREKLRAIRANAAAARQTAAKADDPGADGDG